MIKQFKLWFGFSVPVRRRTYLVNGVGLMALKYVVDSALAWTATGGRFLDPIAYLHPSISYRWKELMGTGFSAAGDMGWYAYASILWAFPFIWIGVGMSARRARDAGWSPWFGLLFFLPVVNLLVILALCVARSTPSVEASPVQDESGGAGHLFKSALQAIAATSLLGLGAIVLSVRGFEDYGASVFMGTPFVMGALCAWFVNRHGYRGWKPGVGVAVLSVLLCGGSLLLFALEGAICLVTAAPICIALAVLGALVGNVMVQGSNGPQSSMGAMALALPILGVTQIGAPPVELPVYAVVSSIDIDAPPGDVWPNVIGFSELPPPQDWLMKTGIAVPLRARIEGEGVGAIRYCEFSTGPFVEPITVWEPPSKLGFDVIEQPPSMKEWSPYQVVHAPHLVGNMVSRRGQFELIALPSGGTRLKGTTWYTIDMAPGVYWSSWADFAVHGIHDRVLGHIKRLSESTP